MFLSNVRGILWLAGRGGKIFPWQRLSSFSALTVEEKWNVKFKCHHTDLLVLFHSCLVMPGVCTIQLNSNSGVSAA